ncbi:unnamed protein product [Heligmosomoides polygyrus]|uniref:Zgc: n=1 Tax=Heligmosomoides polygyrus TaxID=6339 RepID=A0A183F6G8_HELPZ|nr:unnamed protein product [Heligmosomoides polygyrus]
MSGRKQQTGADWKEYGAQRPKEAVVGKSRPKKMKGEKLDMREFKTRGPLKMKLEFKGTVRHDLDKEDSASLRDLKYDKDLNSLVLIGTEIEKLAPQSQMQSKIQTFSQAQSAVRHTGSL